MLRRIRKKMKIDYLVFIPDSLTFTIARALSYLGHRIDVWLAHPHPDQADNRSLQRVASLPGVRIERIGIERKYNEIDRLIIQIFPRLMEQRKAIKHLVNSAKYVTLVTAGDRSHGWRKAMRLQWLELREVIRLRQVDRIGYKDGFYPIDLFRCLLKPRQVVGFDVHAQFLLVESAFRKIHAQDWSPDATRPISANFLGSRDPDIRARILDSVRSHFSRSERLGRTQQKSMFWHEYSDSIPGGVAPDEFLDVLSKSDFTLCPPGYSLVTHRPLEALLRGSIPVLNANELDLYDVGFEDGKNCIAVSPDHWSAAMQRIQRIDEKKLIEMRFEIRSIYEEYLDYAACAHRICSRLGVEKIANRISL